MIKSLEMGRLAWITQTADVITRVLIGRRVRIREGDVMKEAEVRVKSLLKGARGPRNPAAPRSNKQIFS